jgi:cobalt-zinc-cadmium efflux system outer membrane protein
MNHGSPEMPQWTSSRYRVEPPRRSICWPAESRKIFFYGVMLLAACFLSKAAATVSPASIEPSRHRSATSSATSTLLSIDQLVPLIIANNPNLRVSLMAQSAARAGITSAQAFQNPRVELTRGANTARVAGATTGPVQAWSVSQFIENPAVRNARIDGARAFEKDSEQQARITRNELVAQVRTWAYQGLLYQAQSTAAAEAVLLLEQVRERVRVRVESGDAARYEIIKADAEIINARERLLTTSLMAEQILIELNRLAAGQLPAGWALTGDLSEDLEMLSLMEIQQHVRQHNPELAALQAQVLQSQAQLRSAQGSRWPGLELRYSQMRDPELRQGQLSVGVQVPFMDTRSGPIAQASAELQRAEARLEGRKAELQQQILVISKSLEIARLRIEALSQGSVIEAEAALRVAQAAYRFGERGILDVLDAQRVLRSVRADLIDARYQLQVARIALEQLMGQHANNTPY